MLSTMDLQNLVLRPNCLLTPSPLVFIPGPRSVFFYSSPFAQLPGFLHEHGYRAQILSLPFRHRKERALAFTKWLRQNATETFHFILAESTYAEFKILIPFEQVASLTVLTYRSLLSEEKTKSDTLKFIVKNSFLAQLLTPIFYRAHQLICFLGNLKAISYSLTFSNANRSLHERFLDHCIKLAENELYA